MPATSEDQSTPATAPASNRGLRVRDNLRSEYADVMTPEAIAAMHVLAGLNVDQQQLMAKRIARRARRFADREVYDAADELGLLVLQDFPLQWGYARSVRHQAVEQATARYEAERVAVN